VILIFHDLSKYSTSKEDHVLTSGWIFNAKLELVSSHLISLSDLVKVEFTNVLLKTARKSGVHTAATRKNNVLVELGTGIHVGGLDGVEKLVSDTSDFKTDERGVEQSLRSLKTFSSDLNHTTVRKRVGFDEDSGLEGELLLEVEVITNVAKLFLDLTDSFEISGSVEGITTEKEKLNQITSNITSSDINTLGQVRKSKTFVAISKLQRRNE
jgi:hypothetical protein